MLIVDFISPVGHKVLNDFFISSVAGRLEKETCIVFAKKNYANTILSKKISFFSLPNIFGDGKHDVQGLLSYLEAFIYSLFFLLYYVVSLRFLFGRKILFLSYNSVSHFLLFFMLKLFCAKIYVFEHNSIPSFSGGGFILFFKRIIFKLSSCCVTHIVFEGFIKKQLELRYKAHVHVVNHPCLFDEAEDKLLKVSQKSEKYWFSPSGSTGDSFNDTVSRICVARRVKFYVKSSSFVSQDPLVVVKSRFNDYYVRMINAELILINSNFESRVSGVFYESIASSRPVVLTESDFAFYVSEIYPNVFVANCKNLEAVIDKALSSETVFFNSKAHNLKVENDFLRCING